jgi:hypothetical protein
MSKLIECEYLTENDYDYLRNDEEWIERMRAKALNDYEVSQLKKLMLDLKTCGMAHINDMFAVGPLKFYFNKQDFTHSARNASGLQGTASQDKFQVKAAFIATIIRFLILKEHADQLQLSQNYPEVSASCDRLTFLGKYPFLEQEYGTSIELTWLNRFERSLRYLKRFVPPERNKILYLTVGNHLEGSTLYTTYITGGANRPETERRVRIFDSLCQVAPRKRTRKPDQLAGATVAGAGGGDSSSAAPGLGLTAALMTTAAIAYEGSQAKTKQENYSKKKQRGTATTAGVTAGGGVLPSSRSFSSFPPAISLARSHSYTAPSPPFPFQYQQFQFPPAFHLSRQTSSASFQSDVTSSSSDNIPYELSVLLAAVESQIKADAIDLDDDEDKDYEQQEEQEQEDEDRNNCKNDNDHNEYSLTICPSSSDLTTGSFSSSTNNNNNNEKKNNSNKTSNHNNKNENNKKKEPEQLPLRPSSSSASSSQDLEEEEEEDTTDTPSSLSSPSQNGVPPLLPRRSFSTSSMNAALASTSIQQPPTNNSINGTDPSSHNYGTRNRSFSANNNNIIINNNNKISV